MFLRNMVRIDKGFWNQDRRLVYSRRLSVWYFCRWWIHYERRWYGCWLVDNRMGRGMHGNNKRGRGYSHRRISIFCCRLIQGFLPLKAQRRYGKIVRIISHTESSETKCRPNCRPSVTGTTGRILIGQFTVFLALRNAQKPQIAWGQEAGLC